MPQLPNCFQKRQRLNITDGATDLDDGNIVAGGAALDVVLDLVGDVRNDLHRGAQVLTATLFFDHRVVDLTGGEVVAPRQPRADKSLVVPQVQVRLGPVFGDKDLAVLQRIHRAWVYVDIGVQLLDRNLQPPRL